MILSYRTLINNWRSLVGVFLDFVCHPSDRVHDSVTKRSKRSNEISREYWIFEIKGTYPLRAEAPRIEHSRDPIR